MLSNTILTRYYKVDSVVHKLSPIFKIISLFLMIISIFFVDSYIDIIMLSMYLMLALAYSNIPAKVYLKNLWSIKIFLAIIAIIDIIAFMNIERVVHDLFKLIFVVLYSNILTLTTPISEITYGIEKILTPFNHFLPVSDIAMTISLTLRYIPSLSEESNRIINAQKLRGVNFDTRTIKEKIASLNGVFIPMFSLSMNRAASLANVMETRLYGYGKSRTNYRTSKWNKLDLLLLILNILILIIIVIY